MPPSATYSHSGPASCLRFGLVFGELDALSATAEALVETQQPGAKDWELLGVGTCTAGGGCFKKIEGIRMEHV